MTDNEAKLIDCFVQGLGIEAGLVTDDLTYNSVRQWDSVGHMALMTEIETVFDIMLDTEDIIGLSSVAKAKALLVKYGVAI